MGEGIVGYKTFSSEWFPMPAAMKGGNAANYEDYIGNYERSLENVVEACGGREKANLMLGELRGHYEETNRCIRDAKRRCGKDNERFASEKVKLLTEAQEEVRRIIEKYAPGSADRVRELVFGTSLAMSAMLVPVTYAVSALNVATSIVSVGSHYRRMNSPARPAAAGGFTAPRIGKMRLVRKK